MHAQRQPACLPGTGRKRGTWARLERPAERGLTAPGAAGACGGLRGPAAPRPPGCRQSCRPSKLPGAFRGRTAPGPARRGRAGRELPPRLLAPGRPAERRPGRRAGSAPGSPGPEAMAAALGVRGATRRWFAALRGRRQSFAAMVSAESPRGRGRARRRRAGPGAEGPGPAPKRARPSGSDFAESHSGTRHGRKRWSETWVAAAS